MLIGATILLTRIMGVKEYGIYVYVISWVSLLSVPATMGMDTLLVREVAEYKARGRLAHIRGIMNWSNKVVVCSSLALAGVWFVLCRVLFEDAHNNLAGPFLAGPFIVLLLALNALKRGAIQGLVRVIMAQIPLMVVMPGGFLFLVALYCSLYQLNASSAIILYGLAAALAFLTAWKILYHHYPDELRERPALYCRGRWIRTALPLMFTGVVTNMNHRLSIVLVGAMLDPEAAGILDVSIKGATVISFVLAAVNMPLAPAVARLYAMGRTQELQAIIRRSTRMAFLVSVPMRIGLILWGPWVLSVFGKEFSTGATALFILAIAQLIDVAAGSVRRRFMSRASRTCPGVCLTFPRLKN